MNDEAKLVFFAKEAEKRRRLNLTPAELKAENKAKRLANKMAKQAALLAQTEALLLANPVIPDDADSKEEENNPFDDDEIDDISGGPRHVIV